jgi:hypothetical protein
MNTEVRPFPSPLSCPSPNRRTSGAITTLAQKADAALQATLATPPVEELAQLEWEIEMKATKERFGGGAGRVPKDLYQGQVRQWFARLHYNAVAEESYMCGHPACATEASCSNPHSPFLFLPAYTTEASSSILRSDFDERHRARGQASWQCPRGHTNVVADALPDAHLERMIESGEASL